MKSVRMAYKVEGGYGLSLTGPKSICGREQRGGVSVAILGADGLPGPGVVLSRETAIEVNKFLSECIAHWALEEKIHVESKKMISEEEHNRSMKTAKAMIKDAEARYKGAEARVRLMQDDREHYKMRAESAEEKLDEAMEEIKKRYWRYCLLCFVVSGCALAVAVFAVFNQ